MQIRIKCVLLGTSDLMFLSVFSLVLQTCSGCVHLPRQHDRHALAEAGSEHNNTLCRGAKEITQLVRRNGRNHTTNLGRGGQRKLERLLVSWLKWHFKNFSAIVSLLHTNAVWKLWISFVIFGFIKVDLCSFFPFLKKKLLLILLLRSNSHCFQQYQLCNYHVSTVFAS